jgi:hypothetical protein
MSLPKQLSDATLAKLVDALALRETHAEGGGPWRTLVSPMGPAPVGGVRLFRGDAIQQLVTVSIAVPMIRLDSHMLFAFTLPDSQVPHFTLDSVFAGSYYAFHLDLIPRVDLGSWLGYMDGIYGRLTEVFEAGRKHDGLSEATLSPRQLALMSPWMLAHRATEASFAGIGTYVNAYLDHWLGLMKIGVPADARAELTSEELAARDRRNRAALFNPAVDPVWAQVERLIGADAGEQIRGLLRSQA